MLVWQRMDEVLEAASPDEEDDLNQVSALTKDCLRTSGSMFPACSASCLAGSLVRGVAFAGRLQ